MRLDDLMTKAGLTARPQQVLLSTQLEDALARDYDCAAVQASTGVGKTWTAAGVAYNSAAAGSRVVWSTHTIFQRKHVMETMQRALAGAGSNLQVCMLRGMTDFPSRTRTLRLLDAMRSGIARPELVQQLTALADFTGTIDEFTAASGDLLVSPRLVTLTPSCPEEERKPYLEQREAAKDADIVVQTHAMTLLQLRFKRLQAGLVIFDEADTIQTTCDSYVDVNVTFNDLEDLAASVGTSIRKEVRLLRTMAGTSDLVPRNEQIMTAVAKIAGKLKKAAPKDDPDLRQACQDMVVDLNDFARIDGFNSAAMIREGRPGVFSLCVASIGSGLWIASQLKDVKVVLMSATLGAHEGADLASDVRNLGFKRAAQIHVTPDKFGSMKFVLADRLAPLPFVATEEGEEGEYFGCKTNPLFYDYAADMIRQARATGRTLVLCASYGDVQAIGDRMGDEAIQHARGEAVASKLPAFLADPNGVLLTPAAWAGLDLPYQIDNVVIVRVPVSPPNKLRAAILAATLEKRGGAIRGSQSGRLLFAADVKQTVRRLMQGMGRGIRAEDDSCTIWICDPRFPLPASLAAYPKSRIGQGPATGRVNLSKAIPIRFRSPPGRSAFDRAKIVPYESPDKMAAD